MIKRRNYTKCGRMRVLISEDVIKTVTVCYTVDPWTTWVWTARVHLQANFFSVVNTVVFTCSVVGWLHRCGVVDMEELCIWRAKCKLCEFSSAQESLPHIPCCSRVNYLLGLG